MMTKEQYERTIELSLIRIDNITNALNLHCENDTELYNIYTNQIELEKEYIIKVKTKYLNYFK